MLYNENITYDQSGISYVGTIIINVFGLPSPIVISNINVAISTSQDYSNQTTVGVISYDIFSDGIITIQATETQASAIVQAIAAYDESSSGVISLELSDHQANAVAATSTVSSTSANAEITLLQF